MECMEYYGVKQGLSACRDYYDDMMECKFKVGSSLDHFEVLYFIIKTPLSIVNYPLKFKKKKILFDWVN